MNQKRIVFTYVVLCLITVLQCFLALSIFGHNARPPFENLSSFLKQIQNIHLDPSTKEDLLHDVGVTGWYTWQAARSLLELSITYTALMLGILVCGMVSTLRPKKI